MICSGGTFRTQTALNALTGCTEIQGSVFLRDELSGVDMIKNLSPLDSVVEIQGDLVVKNPFDPTTDPNIVDAFPALTSATSIWLEDMSGVISSFDGFHSLLSTIDSVDVYQMYALESLTGFENLERIGGSFEFYRNIMLREISGFGSLTSVGMYGGAWGQLVIHYNDALEKITAFPKLTEVGYSFQVNSNPALISMCGFAPYLTHINDAGISFQDGASGCGNQSSACGYFDIMMCSFQVDTVDTKNNCVIFSEFTFLRVRGKVNFGAGPKLDDI